VSFLIIRCDILSKQKERIKYRVLNKEVGQKNNSKYILFKRGQLRYIYSINLLSIYYRSTIKLLSIFYQTFVKLFCQTFVNFPSIFHQCHRKICFKTYCSIIIIINNNSSSSSSTSTSSSKRRQRIPKKDQIIIIINSNNYLRRGSVSADVYIQRQKKLMVKMMQLVTTMTLAMACQ